MTRSECHADAARDTYLCTADYEFGAPVSPIDVECTLASITVPNHVHLLHAEMGGKRDEAIFDIGFTRATLRFVRRRRSRRRSRRQAREWSARWAARCRGCSWRRW